MLMSRVKGWLIGKGSAWLDEGDRSWGMLAPFLLLVIPAVVLLPNLSSFPYPGSGSPYSDLSATHYPNAIYLLRALKEWRTIPLWSPTILSGYPFVSHPLSGLFYPPGWLALLFPLPAGFTLVVGLHLVWGGVGMYRLMRFEGRSQAGAAFAGVAFAALPKIYAHFGAGHLTLVYALAWTPWVLAAQAAGLGRVGRNSWPKWLPGFLIGLTVLADVRWGVFTWLVSAGYAISHRHILRWASTAYTILKQTLAAAITATPLILLLWEFTGLSTRSSLSAQDALQYSLPILRLFGLIVPDIKNNHEWVVYPGALIILLTMIGIINPQDKRARMFWGTLAAASLMFSLGANLPGVGQILDLPVLNLLRVPARGLFLTDISLCALAGLGLDRILAGFDTAGRRAANLVLFLSAVLSVLLIAGISIQLFSVTINDVLEPALLILGYVWFTIMISRRIHSKIWLSGLFCLSILGWVHLAQAGIQWRDEKEVLSESRSVALYVTSEGGTFRTYSPSYSLPQHTAVQFNLETADGIDPMQLANYTSFMERASGVPFRSYSVTLPPFETGSPQIDNKESRPDAHLLGLLNIRYVLSAFEIQSEGLVLEKIIDGILIYRNEYQKPRAWVQDGLAERGADQIREASVRWSPNHIEVRARGPGHLVLSEIAYPGWKVLVNGQPENILVYQDILRAVELDEGEHKVEFIFQPQGLLLGFAVWFAVVAGICTAKMMILRKTPR